MSGSEVAVQAMDTTPKGLRLHIGLFGRRNVGKSSLVNALCGQQVSLVCDTPGTTTDPVEKALESPVLGPVVFVDTAGLDDQGELGGLRVDRAQRVFDRVDVAILVARADEFGPFEEALLEKLAGRRLPVVVALNLADVAPSTETLRRSLTARGVEQVCTVATRGDGLEELKAALARIAPRHTAEVPMVGDLVPPGELCILVTPIDSEAPRGRLLLPQVQAIRDLLDHDTLALVVKEGELRPALERLRRPPALVVTDSQAFQKVAADVPLEILLTSFSILMARQKGDLPTFVRGTLAIDQLRPGDRVLIAEACTHHPHGEDIGRVKIPRWLSRHVGGPLVVEVVNGRDFPDDLSVYSLVVHCGGCMLNRAAVLGRLSRCLEAGVPVTNYGMAIAYSLGIFERALSPFPGARASAISARPRRPRESTAGGHRARH